MRIILIIFLLSALHLHSQLHSFINHGIEEGLAQSQVNCIHQDKLGYLWAATASGLSRYDGHVFMNFYKSDGLVDNVVISMTETRDGKMIFGCVGGFNVWDGRKLDSYPLPKTLEENRIQYLELLNDSVLCIGTNGGGHLRYSFSSNEFTAQRLASGKSVRFLDHSLQLIASEKGLSIEGNFLPALHNISVTDVVQYDGSYWVSSLREGLFHFSSDWQIIERFSDPPFSSIRHILLTDNGELWLSAREGAIHMKDGKWKVYDRTNGLPYSNVRYATQDNEGNIWLATNGQGIYRYSGGLFTTYVDGNPLLNDKMLSAVEIPDVGMLMGMFDSGAQILTHEGEAIPVDGIPITDVWVLRRDSKGHYWAGTSNGLYHSEEGLQFSRVLEKELLNSRITSLFEDDQGNIWVGHKEGVSVIYGMEEVANYSEESGYYGKRVRSIIQSADGAIWTGAQNGLIRIEEDWMLHLTEEDGLNDNTIYSITSDDTGRLWVGAKTGLHVLMNDSVVQVMISGRPDANNIDFLDCSVDNNLIIGTNQGLFISEVEQDVHSMSFKKYGLQDGLPGLECNLNSAFQQKDKDIWFGTNMGVVRFSEASLKAASVDQIPKLQITDLRLFAERFDWENRTKESSDDGVLKKELVLQPSENHLTFDYRGILLQDPGSVRYRYMLQGVDGDWSPITSQSSVIYSALSHGEYQFKVRCVDEAGLFKGEEASLSFKILPPIYLRWWAILIECALITLIIRSLIRWRQRVLTSRNELMELGYRNRMHVLEQQSLNSSMNRHFIFNSLNAIQFYINREDKRSANKYLSSFAKLIRMNLDSTTNTWVTLKDELERLQLYLTLEHMRFENKFDYKINIEQGLDVGEVKVPAMLLQPFVENSIWHGILPKEEKGHVTLDVARHNGRLSIVIADDGIGIDHSRALKEKNNPDHESKGMDITHHRIRLYGEMTGTDFEIKGPEQIEKDGIPIGTRIELLIPVVR